jgi:hypothetical protein
LPGCRYESAPLEPIGLGNNLQPNAVRELAALGLANKLAGLGILTAELAFYNRHGQLIWTEPRAVTRAIAGRKSRSRAAPCRRFCSRPSTSGWGRARS